MHALKPREGWVECITFKDISEIDAWAGRPLDEPGPRETKEAHNSRKKNTSEHTL